MVFSLKAPPLSSSHSAGLLSDFSSELSDTVYRQVGTGAQILRDMGVKKMRLMSAPMKFSALSGFDLEVVDVISNPE